MSESDNHKGDNNQNLVTVYIDDVEHHVSQDNNLLAGVLSQKINLPYFCWHPSMGSVGACRQCAVTQYQDEKDKRGRIVMACTTPVTNGMRISLKDPHSANFREQVIAAMMTNHPHDCPVCAEGGECHLQDMTVMTGHSQRKYKGTKRTFTNQNLGDLVGHEMNRCITCYRCVRFYKDYAGGNDFDVFGSKNQVYFGRQEDGALESEFSGNLVEVCPTGVFTNKRFSAHYTRKWDLQSAPSVCAHCAVGCNTSIGERYGTVRRVVNRYNEKINGYFLCDRGRFGIGFVNGEQRLRIVKGIEQQSPERISNLDVAKALVHFRYFKHQDGTKSKQGKFIGIGSARASLEANFYLKKLVGKTHFSAGLSNKEMALSAHHQSILSKYTPPNLQEVEQSDFILIIGEDVTQTSPRMALAIRQALRNASKDKASAIGIPSWQDSAVRTVGGKVLSPLYSLQCLPTKLDEVAEQAAIVTPEEMIFCINTINDYIEQHVIPSTNANELVTDAIKDETNRLEKDYIEKCLLTNSQSHFINALLGALMAANKPLIVTGGSLQSARLLEAITGLMKTLHSEKFKLRDKSSVREMTKVSVMPAQCNSIGLLALIDESTLSVEQMVSLSADQDIAGLIIVEQELAQLTQTEIDKLRQQCKTIIVLDHSKSRLSEIADIVMPVSAVSESEGHFVNYQSKIQAYFAAHPSVLPVQENWRWLNLLEKSVFNIDAASTTILHPSISHLHQYFSQAHADWPIQNFDDISSTNDSGFKQGVARQTHRVSGRTAQMANQNVHEVKTTQNNATLPDKQEIISPLNFSMEGRTSNQSNPQPFVWAPGWNSNQAINHHQEDIFGGESNTSREQFISFREKGELAKQLIEKWQGLDVDYQLKQYDEQYINHKTLTFVDKTSWYNGEWQANFNPEFNLMHKGNQVYLSKESLGQRNWQVGQFVNINVLTHDGFVKRTSVAQLYCDEHLPDDLVYGHILAWSHQENNCQVELVEANEKEISAYQQQENQREKAALQEKKQIQRRCNTSDQMIPIRLVAGGLDDV
jgi:NADH-quinone oxidoreductase subunit G